MQLLITKKDFPAYVPFAVNVGDHLVLPHIQDAQYIDLAGLLLPAELLAMETNIKTYSRTEAEFAFFEFDPREWFAEPVETEWADENLYRLYLYFVRPLLVCEAYRRMLPYHGHHFTPNGLESISDVGHQPISSGVRNELREDILAKCNRYRSRLEIALRTYRGTPATPDTCYPTHRRRAGNGGTKHYAI